MVKKFKITWETADDNQFESTGYDSLEDAAGAMLGGISAGHIPADAHWAQVGPEDEE